MEKWKIAVIVLLFAGFGAFQALQNPNSASTSGEENATAAPTPTLSPQLAALIGKPPKSWNIPANLWMNTTKPIAPSALKGQVTLIEFFRIGCSHCEAAAPFLERTYKMMAPRQLKIISFQSPGDLSEPTNPELNWKTVQQWVKTHGITYPVAFDSNRKLKNQYGVPVYPMMLVVGKEGKVVFAQTGHDAAKEEELTTFLRQALS